VEEKFLTVNEFYDFLCETGKYYKYVILFDDECFYVIGYYYGEHICYTEKIDNSMSLFKKGTISIKDVLNGLKIILRYIKINKLKKNNEDEE